ncbi:MAG: hypothetical protein GY811_21565 [Myxococcales bacterium]|nr:hypothetical protein [Myxococcales bacterium]
MRTAPHHKRPSQLETSARLFVGLCLFALTTWGQVACGQASHSASVEDEIAPVEKPVPDIATVDLWATAPAAEAADPIPEVAQALGKSMGEFHMTYYWIADEAAKSRGNQSIVDKNCKRIARVNQQFKRRLTLEGSGRLKDGRIVTTAGGCKCGGPCFWVADEKYPWGAGVAQRPLAPFRSIAVDPKRIKIGTSLYLAELDGLTMPGAGDTGGFVHDGCVVADDRGGGVRGSQIDFFAAQRGHYKSFFKRHKINRISVFGGGERCQDHAEKHDSNIVAVRGSS